MFIAFLTYIIFNHIALPFYNHTNSSWVLVSKMIICYLRNVKYTYNEEQWLKRSVATHGNIFLLVINKWLAIYQTQKTII